MMIESPRDRRVIWMSLALAAIVFVCYGRLCTAEFASRYDDALTVQHNPRFNPPSWPNVAKFWPPVLSAKDDANLTGRGVPADARIRINHTYGLYAPLTYTVWGALASIAQTRNPITDAPELNPWIFHSANVALHALSAIIAFLVLRRLVHGDWPALAGALLFALHPVQVESVAWVSGMKDVLCGLLSLVTIWQYLAGASDVRPFWRNQHGWLALLAFAGALLSKPSAVTVPLILLVIDVLAQQRRPHRSLRRLVPFIALSIVFGCIAAMAQPATGVPPAPLWARPLVIGDSISFYLWKLLFPMRLALDYGRTPAAAMGGIWFYVAWIVPLLLVIAAWIVRRRAPLLLAALLIFILAPAATLGLTTFLFQFYSTVADHYLYLAMLGPAVALAWLVARFRSRAMYAAVTVLLILLAARTITQCGVWRDEITLFANAENVTARSLLAHANLGDIYLQAGQLDVAQQQLLAANAIAPEHVATLLNLSRLAEARNQREEAIRWLRAAIEIQSARPPELRGNLAAERRRLSELENR